MIALTKLGAIASVLALIIAVIPRSLDSYVAMTNVNNDEPQVQEQAPTTALKDDRSTAEKLLPPVLYIEALNVRPLDTFAGFNASGIVPEGTVALWYLVREQSFAPYWWATHFKEVEPGLVSDSPWLTLGNYNDAHKHFDVRVIAVDANQHQILSAYRSNAMLNDDWRPIHVATPLLASGDLVVARK